MPAFLGPSRMREGRVSAAAALRTVGTPVAQPFQTAQAGQPEPPIKPGQPEELREHGDHPTELWLTADAQRARRAEFRLDDPKAKEFIESTEFISLGCYCGVSRALQAVGLKKHSYPFDWVRTPVFGLIHVLETRFADFLTYTTCADKGRVGTLFGSATWGGSFWHHDPDKPNTATAFTRRAERFLGLCEVPPSRRRLFVWAINSCRELDDAVRLRDTLAHALPRAEVYLLVLIDLQHKEEPACLSGFEARNLLFYRIDEGLFADGGAGWSMQKQAVHYVRAIAFAIHRWSNPRNQQAVQQFSCLRDLCLSVQPFDGGSAALELFFPRRFCGQPLSVRQSEALPPKQRHWIIKPMRSQDRDRSPRLRKRDWLRRVLCQQGLPCPGDIDDEEMEDEDETAQQPLGMIGNSNPPKPVRHEALWSPFRRRRASTSESESE